MIPSQVHSFLSENSHGAVTDARPIGGGCISNGKILTTEKGCTFFLKTNASTPVDMFTRDAEGLAALHVSDGPTVPRVYLFGRDFILLEDLSPAPQQKEYWPDFGRKLAMLHQHSNPEFGFKHDNYIGSTEQVNYWTEDGYIFFAEHRLLFQAKMAQGRGLLGKSELLEVENIVDKLSDLIPPQPASLLHGDLWSGNAITDADGAPAIIDPAAHYGWAEAELAMTTLFGFFPAEQEGRDR